MVNPTAVRAEANEEAGVPAKRNHPDTQYVEDIVERLSAFAPVSSRFMFGGFGLYSDGVMFGLVDDSTLYLRADDENRAEFEAVGSRPWVFEAKGRPMTMSYYPIPEADFDNTEALERWFTSACGAATRVAAAKRPKQTSRSRQPRIQS
ncbi:MAG: TfoX family protein [Chloroflexi bacterium]|nr:TfoX family protein [Chloroflexota bacterium]